MKIIDATSSKQIFMGLLLILSLWILSSCASKKVMVPPVTDPPTQVYQVGYFVWYDLLTDNVPAVKKFYGGLFGWEFKGDTIANPPYTLIRYQGKSIGGIIYTDMKKNINESQWISYLSVPDPDAAADYVMKSGGKVYRKPWNLANRGRVAVVADEQGALLVLIRAAGGDPSIQQPEFSQWLWTELLTSSPDSAISFYKGLAGYEEQSTELTEGHQYHMLVKEKKPVAGIVKNPFTGVKSNWLPYVRVEDPAALVAKVEQLGGKVILAPREDIRKGSVALIADPSGAAVAIQRWPF